MNLEVFILGCGGMMPLPRRHLTSVLLRREGDLFLFDCGEATQISLKKLNLKWKNISTIFISHTHADHVTGLPGILMLSSQVDRTEPLYIIGPPKIKEFVETSIKVLDMYINYEIIVKEITEPGVVMQGENFKVEAFQLDHTKPCFGYKLTEAPRPGIFHPEKAKELGVPMGSMWSALQHGETVILADGRSVTPDMVLGLPRKGRKFSFVTDTLAIPSIAEEVKDSDLFICEGMFEDELAESAHEKKHMTAVEAALIAKSAGGIKQMGLIHYSPRYTDKELSILLEQAQEVFADTFLTRDGQTILLKYED
ncbi:MAG: ribonuclease Z [Spirochaetia bacterium]|nr:ribonuclease Z [Spirochaetia bacterium]MBR0318267.1 ribonuclease Z [Spirochaetia bacterium]